MLSGAFMFNPCLRGGPKKVPSPSILRSSRQDNASSSSSNDPNDELRREAELFRREKERLVEKALTEKNVQPGGDYTESFEAYSFSRDIRMDVDQMNEKLRSKELKRHRYALKPDEAFGIVVDFDEVLLDTRGLLRRSWTQLAEEEGLRLPSIERPQLYSVTTEQAILHVLQWTRDIRRARDLAYRFASIYAGLFAGVQAPAEGTEGWLSALYKANVPVGLVSALDRYTISAALDRMRLRPYFRALSSMEDGFENRSQLLLGACWNLSRPPSLTAYIAASPTSLRAAHNVTMKAVGVQGWHKGFELKGADLKCQRLDDLTVFNVRRLFANRGSELMDLQLQWTGIPPTPRRLKLDMLDPEDDDE